MFLLPTLDRPRLLRKFMDSARKAETSLPGIVLIDSNDYLRHELEYRDLEAQYFPVGWKIHVGAAVTMGDKTREVWNQIKDCEWVGILNDDFEIVTHHWDKIMVSRLDGKNMITSNDRHIRSFLKPSGATIWSMPLLNALGWPIYPPGLQHLFIDDVYNQLGRATGCWILAADVIVLHNHVIDGMMAPDETYKKTYDPFWAGNARDQGVFELFMNHDFQAAVERIKAFQDEIPNISKVKAPVKESIHGPPATPTSPDTIQPPTS